MLVSSPQSLVHEITEIYIKKIDDLLNYTQFKYNNLLVMTSVIRKKI